MAVTVRGRRTAYDNIASGAATGRELTIAGSTASDQEVYGGGHVNSTSNNERDITNIDAAGTSVSNTAPGPDNMTGGVDPTDENVG